MIIKINPEESPHYSELTDKRSSSIKWSQKYKAYLVSNDLRPIEILVVDENGYLQYEAGNYTNIYPSYDKDNMVIECANSFAKVGDPTNKYILYIYRKEVTNELPYGCFTVGVGPHGETLLIPYKEKLKQSNIMVTTHDIKGHVLNFFANKKNGVRKNKSGVLLFGPPGNGKTSSLMEMAAAAEENKFRVIMMLDSELSLRNFQVIKPVLEGDPTVFILEEVTERLRHRAVEEMLTFLDGEVSWDNSVTIATTNYPELMPANLIDRPGRFETFIKFENPTKDQVKTMLDAAGLTEVSADDFFRGKEFSFDYVSYIISVMLDKGLTASEVIKDEEAKRKRLSETFRGTMGF